MPQERLRFVTKVINELDKKVGETSQNNMDIAKPKDDGKISRGEANRRNASSMSQLSKENNIMIIPKEAQSNFKSITRAKYFETHIKNPTRVPPVGAYATRYNEIERKITVPVYGA